MRKMMQDIEVDQARIDAEAAEWLVRQSDGAFTPDDRAAFETWSSSDPRRARTFAAMARSQGMGRRPARRRVMEAWDPYFNIRPDVTYPQVLVVVATTDNQVGPSHEPRATTIRTNTLRLPRWRCR